LKKLDIIRKAKALFMKWNLHHFVHPLSGTLDNAVKMGELSRWRMNHPVKGYNDFYQTQWNYDRRYQLYEAIDQQESLSSAAVDYFEFGVAGGYSFRWWMDRNRDQTSRFFGFDTFEGLPE
jgi:hypothetical protein